MISTNFPLFPQSRLIRIYFKYSEMGYFQFMCSNTDISKLNLAFISAIYRDRRITLQK